MYIETKVRFFKVIKTAWKLQLLILIVVTISTILYLNYLRGPFQVSRTIITVLGMALAFFIGFINSQAYDRWWEARKIWGAITNDSWSLSRMVKSFITDNNLQKSLIYRHIAFLYALIDRLREQDTGLYKKYLNEDEIKAVEGKSNIPNSILALQGIAIDKAQRENQLELFRMVQLNENLNTFSDSMGQSVRIKATVFPHYYKALISSSIWIFIVIFPMVLSERVGYWSILYSFLLGSIFDLIYLAGQSLLNPFEGKPSDTPISTITRNIEIDLLEQLDDKDIPKPLEPVDNLYIL